MLKVSRRRKLYRGWRFDIPLTGLFLVELRAPCGAWSSRARLSFSWQGENIPARSPGRGGEPIRRSSEDWSWLVDRGGCWGYLATGRGDYFPVRLDRFFVAHDRFHFTRGGIGGWEFFHDRFVRGGFGGGFRSGLEVGIEVAILRPHREDLAEEFGHAMSEAEVVFLALGALACEQRFDRWVPFDRTLSGGVEQASHEIVALAAHVDFGPLLGIPLAVGAGDIDLFGKDAEVTDQGGRCGEAVDGNDLGHQRGGGL